MNAIEEAQLAQQAWGRSVHSDNRPTYTASHDNNDEESYPSAPNTGKPLPSIPVDSDTDDSDFGDFEFAAPPLSSLSAPSPPLNEIPSHTSSNTICQPMSFAPEPTALSSLLFSASDAEYAYAPLLDGDTDTDSSIPSRHATASQRVWSLGKMALGKISLTRGDVGKVAKGAVGKWKMGFVEREHGELARVAKAADVVVRGEQEGGALSTNFYCPEPVGVSASVIVETKEDGMEGVDWMVEVEKNVCGEETDQCCRLGIY